MYELGLASTTRGPGAPDGSTPSRAVEHLRASLVGDEGAGDVAAQHVEHHLPDVVPIARVRRARVPEPDDEVGVVRHGAVLAAWLRSRTRRPSRRRPCSLAPRRAASAAPRQPPRRRPRRPRGPRRWRAGSVMLMTTASGSVSSSTPSGSSTAPARTSSASVRPSMETTNASGMWVASASDGQRLRLDGVDRAGRGLALDVDRDVDDDLLAAAHQHQVDVVDAALDRVALDVLGERELRAPVEVQGEQGVGVALQREKGLVAGQREVHRVGAVAVQDGGDEPGAAGTAGGALAELGTDGRGRAR